MKEWGDGKIRVAVIGAGDWGLQHARAFTARPDVRLCAIVGRTLERTRARAQRFDVPYYLGIKEMIDREQPDLVSLCLPNQGHFSATLEVIEAGAPLLVEKPLVFDLGEADRLLEAAAERRLFFAINFNHRYARPAQLARQAISEGRLGTLVFATWRFGGEGASSHPHANLIETQCHGFDTLEYLCGPIASMTAEMTDPSGTGCSTVALTLRFKNGAIGSLLGTYDSSYAYPGTQMLEVNGVDGRVFIEDTVRRYTFHQRGSEIGETWQAGYFNDRDRDFHHTFDVYLEDMLAAFRAGLDPPVPASAGRRALALARTAIEAFHTGRRTKPDDF